MKEFIQSICQTVTVASLLWSPMLITNVMADDCAFNGTPEECAAQAGCEWLLDSYCGVGTPEMSDYLAGAFIVIAGGMVYYTTRKLKVASPT